MPARFLAMYSRPDDVEGFERHYRQTHVPIVQRWEGVTATTITVLSSTPRGGQPPYHLVADVTFATMEDLQAALRSDAGMEAARDAKHMAQTFGVEVTMAVGEDLTG